MLDIKFIKENKDLIKEAARKKHLDFDVDNLLEIDQARLEVLAKVEDLRNNQNKFSDAIMSVTDQSEREQKISEMKLIKESLQTEEENLKKIMQDWQLQMLFVPNVPDVSVPDGDSDEQNQEIKVWGEKPSFDFEPKDHVELMTNLKMVDFERGTKVHGFRGYFLTGDGVRLCFAIWNYAMDFFGQKGFNPVIPPMLVRPAVCMGTGYLPQGEDDLYKTQDGDYLVGTSEVPLMGMHMNEIIELADLPIKYLGFSPCYRREAGSHSKDTKGLIRVHEFYKFEQLVLCVANHEVSVNTHNEINRNTEEFIESLNIPYHTVVNCGGDLGLGQVKKYDVELWVPKESKYREISSASYFHDFQTRRLNIRYRDEAGKLQYTHSLNSTAIPTPRILVSMVENFQQADGSIKIPEVLQKYLGKDVIR
jgi:seryl-tRNA synthetase